VAKASNAGTRNRRASEPPGEPPATDPPGARTLTPAIVAATGFVIVCALASIAFVGARGGLALPLASPSAPAVALASPTPAAAASPPLGTESPPVDPSLPASPAAPTPPPSGAPATPPTGPTATPDPLTALPACPDRPGCYVYTVRRGDTLGRIARRYGLPFATVRVLNPELIDPSVIVIGQPIYLARDPFARLEPCPNRAACHLYVVQPGDRLSTLAGRFGLSLAAILALNPAIDDPSEIYSGQTIRLPDPTP
jgi:LysM repeat protein